jgi:hypothetical protein
MTENGALKGTLAREQMVRGTAVAKTSYCRIVMVMAGSVVVLVESIIGSIGLLEIILFGIVVA